MKHLIKIISFALFVILLTGVSLFGQKTKKKYTISSVVVDESGNPVVNAYVWAQGKMVTTDNTGSFSVNLVKSRSNVILVEAENFEPLKISTDTFALVKKIVLKHSEFQAGSKDVVNFVFNKEKQIDVASTITVIDPEELLKYDNQQRVMVALRGRVPGLYGTNNVNGLGAAVVIVDGMEQDPGNIRVDEVEQIVILRDAASRAMYGAQADKPVILINTKRGEAYKTKLKIMGEFGVSDPISYPKFLNAADYMTLYNEALSNDGLAPFYDSLTIANTRSGVDPVLYPDESYYNSTYLKDVSKSFNIQTEASGGNDVATYYVNFGWKRSGGLLNVGEGAKQSFNRLNVNSNVDFKINQYMKMYLGGSVVYDFNKNPRGDFWGNSATFHPDWYPVLIPSSRMEDSILLAAARLVDGQYLLGGTSEYQTNIYGDLVFGGYNNSTKRNLNFRTALDFDLGFITKGLTANVTMLFNLYDSFNTVQANEYAVYEPVTVTLPTGVDSLYFIKHNEDVKQGDQSVTSSDFTRDMNVFGTLNYIRSFNNHNLNLTALAYRTESQVNGEFHHDKRLHFALQAMYNFKGKYLAELSGVVTGSSKLSGKHQYGFSPTVALGWIPSKEDFLKDNSVINFLKVNASFGIINTDNYINDYYLYETSYTTGGLFTYGNGMYKNRRRRINYLKNPDLSWVKREEISTGFQLDLLNALWIEANYTYSKLYDIVVQRKNYYPAITGGVYQYENYESKMNQGGSVAINYHNDKHDFKYNIGVNFTYFVPKALKVEEPKYEVDYRYLEGNPTDSKFGWVAEGFFRDSADIANHAIQTFGEVQPGDIKYKDLNNDGIIDNNDQKIIGNSNARLQYGINLNLKYKALGLFLLGTGQTGQESYFKSAYYWVYGNRKYSEEVLGRWTEETASTATYPRLSSKYNANNFRNSTFWLYENNWFTLHTAQLTYTFSDRLKPNSILKKGFQVYVRASNLFTISDIKEKRELNVGKAPQTRYYALGLKVTF
ncbi:MAG: SusC/RagA family TonB-linked outer membrane protein [Chlorobi bacterium]|nr:SusC/RagA family TonB-linked outer membrane protein [Chlorobiota bacterium]